MTYCGHLYDFFFYHILICITLCGIIYVFRLMLETIAFRTHYSFSSDAVYTFALVLLRHFPILQIPVTRNNFKFPIRQKTACRSLDDFIS